MTPQPPARAPELAFFIALFAGACSELPAPSTAPSHCDESSSLYDLREASYGVPVDAIEVGTAEPTCVQLLGASGSLCAGQPDEHACAAQAAELRRSLSNARSNKGDKEPLLYALTSHAGHVQSWRGDQDFSRLLGTIDSSVEAWLLLSAREGFVLGDCPESPNCATRTEDGFRISLRKYTSPCPLTYVETTYTIERSGQITRQTGPAHVEPDRCARE